MLKYLKKCLSKKYTLILVLIFICKILKMNTLANGNMCKRRKVFSFNSELYKVTGVQKVLMDIHHAVKEDYDAIIVGTVSYGMVDKSHQIFEDEYKQFKNPLCFMIL